jgi:hypothetical protein
VNVATVWLDDSRFSTALKVGPAVGSTDGSVTTAVVLTTEVGVASWPMVTLIW